MVILAIFELLLPVEIACHPMSEETNLPLHEKPVVTSLEKDDIPQLPPIATRPYNYSEILFGYRKQEPYTLAGDSLHIERFARFS